MQETSSQEDSARETGQVGNNPFPDPVELPADPHEEVWRPTEDESVEEEHHHTNYFHRVRIHCDQFVKTGVDEITRQAVTQKCLALFSIYFCL